MKKNSINIIQTNYLVQNEISKDLINLNKNEKNLVKYNINELNNLSYNEALKIDKRTYVQYYLSLLKTKINLFSEIKKNKTLLLKGLKDIKNIINLKIMKCYYTLFNIDGIRNNIGFYIISSNILFYFISVIIFLK